VQLLQDQEHITAELGQLRRANEHEHEVLLQHLNCSLQSTLLALSITQSRQADCTSKLKCMPEPHASAISLTTSATPGTQMGQSGLQIAPLFEQVVYIEPKDARCINENTSKMVPDPFLLSPPSEKYRL